ncbi:hypothetical protein TraAM80_04283 [Trypanosoma rangeli]|uniref:L-seryl-tRNA(Sec) kinase n=1 Tax=Trypanosoma rangeli TaxID=5698 RepID=A0A422NKD5_TRYRA|nr:uncharacterized protein TraAM80_04283 [Trypanosoma rangeli]RNF05947.1 hypothetical protein TraAM80_04283 [Trypanosoma rangeli]|eukprot:RNF05947.1 hypothetical protein TraAM80_04283 [Trypanosoma rangeli]
MKLCLVLLSGLPGAGKTTLSLTMEQLAGARRSEREGAEARPCGVIEGIFELDTFISSNDEENAMQRNGTAFTPEAWKRACNEVREATLQRLRQCLLSAETERMGNGSKTEASTTRFVFLVDTLPYRSMKASYWKLCRELDKEQLQYYWGTNEAKGEGDCRLPVEIVFVNMVEVRLNTPLEVCLKRNEHRIETPQYVPPHVITSMSESFDVGLDVSFKPRLDDNYWVMLPRQATAPWPVIRLEDAKTNCDLAPKVLAQRLLERLTSREVMKALEEQSTSLFENEVKKRERGMHQQNQQQLCESVKASRSDWLHQVDLHMRAIVQRYMEELKETGKLRPGIGVLASKCREEQYAQLKTMSAFWKDGETFYACKELLLHEQILEFQRRLSAL